MITKIFKEKKNVVLVILMFLFSGLALGCSFNCRYGSSFFVDYILIGLFYVTFIISIVSNFKKYNSIQKYINILPYISLVVSLVAFILYIIYGINPYYSEGYGLNSKRVWTKGYYDYHDCFTSSLVSSAYCLFTSLVYSLAFLTNIYDASKNSYRKEPGVFAIKAKNKRIYINTIDKKIYYKKDCILLDEITDIELLNKTKLVAKTGLGEAIVGGVLFGGIGAVAGAYAGKKDKEVEDYKIVLKTNNVFHSTIFIPASYENCIKIADTLFLLRKNG